MIIGQGDIATVLTDRPDVTFFASGVSNSREKDIRCFDREINLILEQPANRHLVYFSTLSIYYGDSLYVHHKIAMEQLIRRNFESSTIVRIGNIMWGKNPNTLINYFTSKIEKCEPVEIRDEYRHIVTKSDFLYWVGQLRVGINNEMNITGRRMHVRSIYEKIKDKTLATYLEL